MRCTNYKESVEEYNDKNPVLKTFPHILYFHKKDGTYDQESVIVEMIVARNLKPFPCIVLSRKMLVI